MQGVIINGLTQANYFSQAIDESADSTDTAQMCVYVRYFDGKEFRELLLSLIPLEGHATGDIVFTKVAELFKPHSLSFEKVKLMVTDGAPATVGKHRGPVSRLKELTPKCMDHIASSTSVLLCQAHW